MKFELISEEWVEINEEKESGDTILQIKESASKNSLMWKKAGT